MSAPYTFYADVAAEAAIPENGTLSRTLYQDDHVKVLVFAFAAGQELSAHTAPMAAAIHILTGQATLTLGEDVREVQAGAFVHMQPQLPHAIAARTAMVMLLTMYKQARG